MVRPLVLLALAVGCTAALRCYCTEDHCVPYGACDGSVCLVGILRDNNQVIRTCGSRTLGCHRDEDDKWTDLCACDQPFCNTFAYLRAHTSSRRDSGPAPDEVPLVFSRVDRPEGEPGPPPVPISTKTSLLTLLLVVVPLTVGAATIMSPSITTATCAEALSSSHSTGHATGSAAAKGARASDCQKRIVGFSSFASSYECLLLLFFIR